MIRIYEYVGNSSFDFYKFCKINYNNQTIQCSNTLNFLIPITLDEKRYECDVDEEEDSDSYILIAEYADELTLQEFKEMFPEIFI